MAISISGNPLELKTQILVLQRDLKKLKETNDKCYNLAAQHGEYIGKRDFITLDYKIKDFDEYVKSLVQRSAKI